MFHLPVSSYHLCDISTRASMVDIPPNRFSSISQSRFEHFRSYCDDENGTNVFINKNVFATAMGFTTSIHPSFQKITNQIKAIIFRYNV